jgi:hypothetical protein
VEKKRRVVVRAQVLDPKITTNHHFLLQRAKVVRELQLVRALRVPRRSPEGARPL